MSGKTDIDDAINDADEHADDADEHADEEHHVDHDFEFENENSGEDCPPGLRWLALGFF